MASTNTPAEGQELKAGLGLLRTAQLAQTLTVTWMALEAGVSLWAGLSARSVALVAFGADSLIEVVSAGVVLHHLSRSSGASDGAGAREERTAHVVGWLLMLLIAYVLLSSGYALFLGHPPSPSLTGIGICALALVITPILWRWRIRLASSLDSPALRADAACSMTCMWLAATVLVGVALNALLGWWWADPIAGLLIIRFIWREAREALQAGSPAR